MARCKLTNMNLRNIRKSREYQCILIDLVSAGVVEQSKAEELLGYTIPAGLLENPVTPDDDDDDDDEGGDGSDETAGTVTLLYLDEIANDSAGEWLSEEFTLTEGATFEQESDAIIAAAQTAFGDNNIGIAEFVQLNPEYVEGTSELKFKYITIVPQPEAFENGQLIQCSANSKG